MLAAKSPVFKTALWCHGGFVHLLYTVCDLEQLLAHGDYVNIHWPHYLETECLMWTSISRAEHIWQKQLIRTSLQFKSIIFQFGLQVKLQSLPETDSPAAESTERETGSLQRLRTTKPTITAHVCTHASLWVLWKMCVCAHVEKQTHTNTISSVLPAWVFPCYLSPQEDSGGVIPAGLQGERSLSLQAQNNKRDENAAFVSGSVESVHHQIK